MREGLGGKLPPRVEADLAVGRQPPDERRVALRPAHGDDVDEVLCRSPKQRGAADVDHLDRLCLAHVPAAGDALEGVEVHAHEVDRQDPLRAQVGEVGWVVAARQDARVDAGMERLYPSLQELRHVRDLLDGHDVQAELRDGGGGAPTRHELDSQVGEAVGQLRKAGLVEDRDERSLDHGIRSLDA